MYRTESKKIFNALEQAGFHVKAVKFLDGYFVFKFDKDSVVHFYIKELKGWKFGIWFWKDKEDTKFDFFTQYERSIDKFKPSASNFVLEDADIRDFDLERIVKICRFIKSYPFKAWQADMHGASELYEYVDLRWGFFEWLWDALEYNCLELMYKCVHKRYLVLMAKVVEKAGLIEPELVDNNVGGCVSSPRYTVVCEGKKGEELVPGYHTVEAEELPEKLQKEIAKYEKRRERFSKLRWRTDDLDISDMNFVVKGEVNNKN